jgi:hypothetical protein
MMMMFPTIFVALYAFFALHGMCAGYDPDDIFPSNSDTYNDWAICKDAISTAKFPNLFAPTKRGGCVRYFQGVDITGVVTEKHFFHKDGVTNACDCIITCLQRPLSCTNWVYKHIFEPKLDGGYRSCTLYSSPNLPSNVTLAYNLTGSTGYSLLQTVNNPQPGAPAPFTFSDSANTKVDNDGVSGLIFQDQDNKLHC